MEYITARNQRQKLLTCLSLILLTHKMGILPATEQSGSVDSTPSAHLANLEHKVYNCYPNTLLKAYLLGSTKKLQMSGKT